MADVGPHLRKLAVSLATAFAEADKADRELSPEACSVLARQIFQALLDAFEGVVDQRIRQAVNAEREALAGLVEKVAKNLPAGPMRDTFTNLAAAVRKRIEP